jgi:hypothetical protein
MNWWRSYLKNHIYKSRQAAMTSLRVFENLGILESKASGKETLFINNKLLALMAYDSHDFEAF